MYKHRETSVFCYYLITKNSGAICIYVCHIIRKLYRKLQCFAILQMLRITSIKNIGGHTQYTILIIWRNCASQVDVYHVG